jgi:hypothetical protein
LVAAGESGAYVLEREGPIWTAQQLLSPSDTEHGGGFAWTIALSGNTALLGAPEHGELDDFEGAVYLFERGPLGFIEEERLTTPAIDSADDEFGVSVSIDGDTVVVGSPGEDHSDCNDAGAVYVFERQGMGWTGPQRLAASLPSSEARFGSAVGVDGDTLAVGAPHALFPVSDPGAVHVFERSTSGWIERQTLSPTLGPGLNFGIAVALEGDMLIAGAGYDDVDGLFGAGAVYFYARTGSEFVEAQRLTADAPQSFGKFGHSLGLDRNRSVVTGIEDQHAIAYVFAWRLGTWSLEQKIAVTPPPLGKSDVSIPSVAIDEGTTFVGEPWTAVSGEHEAGVVRHYVLVGATCSTATECPGGFCTDGVCCDAACDGSCDGCAQPGFRGRCTVVESGARGDPSCAPYSCDGTSDRCSGSCSSDDSCASGARCTGHGACVVPGPAGAACADVLDCESGFCVDGVCCDSQCESSCHRCNLTGNMGRCVTLDCTPYACLDGGGACSTRCASTVDCSPGYACRGDGECVIARDVNPATACGARAPGSGGRGVVFVAAVALALARRRRAGCHNEKR